MDNWSLDKYRRWLRSRIPLIGPWLRKTAAERLVEDGSPAVAEALLEAAFEVQTGEAHAAAVECLERIADRGSQEARDALCSLAVEVDASPAGKIAKRDRYAPRDPTRRALFYFMTEQWKEHRKHDPDYATLTRAYEAADPGLRARLAKREMASFIRLLPNHGDDVRSFALAPDSTLLVTGGGESDTSLCFWRLPEARLIRATKPRREKPNSAAQIAVGRGRPSLLLLEAEQVVRESFDHLAINAGGAFLVSGGESGKLRVWELPEGHELRALGSHSEGISGLAFVPGEDDTLVSSALDGTVCLWNAREGEQLGTIDATVGQVNCIQVSPDGKSLAVGGNDPSVQLWSLPGGDAVRALAAHSYVINSLAFGACGRVLASGSGDGTVAVWELPEADEPQILEPKSGSVRTVAVHSENRLVAAGCSEGAIHLWRLPDREPVARLQNHHDSVTHLAFRPDGRMLASGSRDSTVQLWAVPQGNHLVTFDDHEKAISCLGFEPSGSALISGSADTNARLWPIRILRLSGVLDERPTSEDLEWLKREVQDGGQTERATRWLSFLRALMEHKRYL